MKHVGGLQKRDHLNIGQIFDNMAKDLQKPTPRFNAFWNYKPIPLYMGESSFSTVSETGYFRTKKKVRVICAGNRSVKTWTSLLELIMVFTGIVPPSLQGIYPWEQTLKDCLPGGKHPRARRCRIIVQNYTTHWPTVIKPILLGGEQSIDTGLLPEGWDEYDKETHIFTGPDGSILHIFSADPRENVDPVFLRGGQFDMTVIDEPNTQAVFEESIARIIAVPHGLGFVTIEYCPQDGFESWHYKQLYKAGYNPETYEPLPPDEADPHIFVQVATPMDNPSVTEEGLQALKATCRPWEIDARVYGRYSAMGENAFFPVEILSKWQVVPDLNAPYEYAQCDVSEVDADEADFEPKVEFMLKTEGDKIYEKQLAPLWKVWHKPQDKKRYVLTADCSAGRRDSDYQASDIWDATDYAKPFQVAQFRMQACTILDFAYQCAMIGTYYGEILIAPEANTYGEAFIQAIRNYGNMYVRAQISSRIENPDEKKYGWSSNIHSKLNMLENLYEFINKSYSINHVPFRSIHTVNELISYQEKIRNDHYGATKREWGAKSGMHDDTVTTCGIAAWIIRKEYEKINIVRLNKDKKKINVDLHAQRMKQSTQENRCYNGMLQHKKKSLIELRRANTYPRRRGDG